MLSALVSDRVLAWRERRRALRELGDLTDREESSLARDDQNPVNRAKVSLVAGDRDAALRSWDEAKTRYPRFARESGDAVFILLGLERFDEAEALTLERQRREPGNEHHATGHALVAERRGATEEAIRRWQQVRKRFPENWRGYVHGAICLRTNGQVELAEEMLETATKRFPEEITGWLEWARTAEQRGDWPEAIRRWRMVFENSRHLQGAIGVARGLEELGRIEEAEAWLLEARFRFGQAPEIPIALARLAEKRGDKDTAVARWADVVRRFPKLIFGYQGGARLLTELGRRDEAATLLLAAIDQFPKADWPAVTYAWQAHAQKDWAAAETRWAAVRAGWPDLPIGYLRGADALAALGRKPEAEQLRDEARLRFPQ